MEWAFEKAGDWEFWVLRWGWENKDEAEKQLSFFPSLLGFISSKSEAVGLDP